MILFWLFLVGLCWGSFLNVLAYRLINNHDWIFVRSFCPHCKRSLAWYELIPVLSWLALKGRCASCTSTISWLYPAIELLTATIITLSWIQFEHAYFLVYGLFFSALIVTIRTDIQYRLVLDAATWYMIPAAVLASCLGHLPLTPFDSVLGMLFGYAVLWIIRKAYWIKTHREGLGEGDLNLLALIGAFTGVQGAWIALMIGSILGTIIGLCYAFYTKKSGSADATLLQTAIPFGPFLALGAILYLFFQEPLIKLLLGGL